MMWHSTLLEELTTRAYTKTVKILRYDVEALININGYTVVYVG